MITGLWNMGPRNGVPTTLASRGAPRGDDCRELLARKMIDPTVLIFPQLGPIYQALAPWAEALLRAVVGLRSFRMGCAIRSGCFHRPGCNRTI